MKRRFVDFVREIEVKLSDDERRELDAWREHFRDDGGLAGEPAPVGPRPDSGPGEERAECGAVSDDGSGKVCRRLCAPGHDYHGGGHWFADPEVDGERVRLSTARWIVTGEQPADSRAG